MNYDSMGEETRKDTSVINCPWGMRQVFDKEKPCSQICGKERGHASMNIGPKIPMVRKGPTWKDLGKSS